MNAKTRSKMTGRPLKIEACGCYDDAVVIEIGGRGHFVGECSFWAEEGDELGAGFLVK